MPSLVLLANIIHNTTTDAYAQTNAAMLATSPHQFGAAVPRNQIVVTSAIVTTTLISFFVLADSIISYQLYYLVETDEDRTPLSIVAELVAVP